MIIIEATAIILNAIIASILLYFLAPLRWDREHERASIIGFSFMVGTIALDEVLLIGRLLIG